MDEGHFNLWKLLEVIARRIRFILVFVFLITGGSIIVSLLLPRWYESVALLMPPREEGFKLGWASGTEDLYSLTSGVRLPLMATPSDIYARILYSRKMAERIVVANNLIEYYNVESMEAALKELDKRSDFLVTAEGLLQIKCIDKQAGWSAQLANSFASELDRMTRELAADRAKLTKKFISNRLSEVSVDLDSARVELENFQKENKAIDLDRQTQLAIEAAVGLKVDLATNEIELNVKEQSLSSTHPQVISLKRRVSEIKKQIRTLEFGGADSSYLNLPISEVPALKIKYAEIMSRLKLSETLFQLLTEQYEQAKIQEQMITPTISVLDRAYPPDVAIKPQKRIIVVATFALSILLALFIVLFQDYLIRLQKRSPDDFERIRYFYITLFGWWPGIKKKGNQR